MPTSMATCQGRRQINARSQSAHVALARDGITGLKVLRRSALRSGRLYASWCGVAWLLLCLSTGCHASSLDQIEADIAAASWDSVIFDLGGDSLVRIPTLEPLRGSKAHVGALLDSVNTAAELVEQLTT